MEHTVQIISRDDAKTQGLTRYFTGTPCKNGHVSERRVTGHACVECVRVRTARYGASEKCKDRRRAFYDRNADTIKQRAASWARENPERRKEIQKASRLRTGKQASYVAHRRASKLRQTPAWEAREREQIADLYKLARYLSETTGVDYHVDHLVPLRADTASGLHCLANLCVTRASDNRRKGKQVPEKFYDPRSRQHA